MSAECPGVQFIAAGRNPSAEMRKYAVAAGVRVTLTGTVPDVRPYYARASLVVVPLRLGGGTKLKTLEAFAMGVPVVSTFVGCEGVEVETGVHCRVAETPHQFAADIVDLLAKPKEAGELARRARQLVRERYDWKQVAIEFETNLEQVVGARFGKKCEQVP